MTEYDRTNTFVLFINDKGENDRAPDRSGSLNVDGVEYFIDGWIKQGKSGPFLSGKIKRKEKQPARDNDADRSRAKAKRAYEGDEETPW
jgi:hypothetical protein